jgi:hypothetical protein
MKLDPVKRGRLAAAVVADAAAAAAATEVVVAATAAVVVAAVTAVAAAVVAGATVADAEATNCSLTFKKEALTFVSAFFCHSFLPPHAFRTAAALV